MWRSCDIQIWRPWIYDDPLLKTSHLGCALMRYFQHQVNHISMSDSLLCIICIVSYCYCIYLTLSVCFMAASINRINSAWHRNQTDFSWETLKSADTILAFTSKLYTTVNTMSAPINQQANITRGNSMVIFHENLDQLILVPLIPVVINKNEIN